MGITEDREVARTRYARQKRVGAARESHACTGAVLGGRWQLASVLAEGSLATIYQARPAGRAKDTPAAYAIKVLRKRWERWGHAIELLRREYTVGRSVAHPHLVTILEGALRSPPYFLVMPRLQGETLEAILNGPYVLSVPSLLWVARQAAEALDALDAAGWIHGDVKPSNLMISPGGHATLLDLGFARRPREENTAVDRCILGTVAYLAPELVLARRAADIRSDIYSLGVLLVRAFSGRVPFEATSLEGLASAHRRGETPDVRRLAPHLPWPVSDLLKRMTARDPLRRPQSPRELIRELVDLEVATFGQHAVCRT